MGLVLFLLSSWFMSTIKETLQEENSRLKFEHIVTLWFIGLTLGYYFVYENYIGSFIGGFIMLLLTYKYAGRKRNLAKKIENDQIRIEEINKEIDRLQKK